MKAGQSGAGGGGFVEALNLGVRGFLGAMEEVSNDNWSGALERFIARKVRRVVRRTLTTLVQTLFVVESMQGVVLG